MISPLLLDNLFDEVYLGNPSFYDYRGSIRAGSMGSWEPLNFEKSLKRSKNSGYTQKIPLLLEI